MSGKHKKHFGSRFALVRFARIAKALRNDESFTARTIAEEFEVATKTIHRDLNCLRDRLGYECEFNLRENKWHLLKAPEPVL